MAAQIGPLLVIVGETASGKSALGLRLAQQFNGEIICADSWTVRQQANIGTAKPTLAEQALVPHHLLDVVGPNEDFTAAVFKQLAEQAITDINGRNKLPVLVGGSGLYIDSILYDFNFLPAGDRQAREELNKMSLIELMKKINEMEIDPGDVDTRNKRRLIRLIETNGARPTKKELRRNTIIIGLRTDQETLKLSVIERVDAMLAAGLEDEVRGLVERYGWECEALKGVGYAQWQAYFLDHEDQSMVRQKIIKATLDLAKRQRTWFKRNKSIHWFDTPVNWPIIVDTVTTLMSDRIHE